MFCLDNIVCPDSIDRRLVMSNMVYFRISDSKKISLKEYCRLNKITVSQLLMDYVDHCITSLGKEKKSDTDKVLTPAENIHNLQKQYYK